MASRHNHQHCLNEALAAAEALCASRGANLTPVRRRVFELIWQGHSAVKAYDIIDAFSDSGGTKPPTVYRALDFLIGQGLVHRLDSLNAFVGCPHPDGGHDSHFLICDDCGDVTEMDSKPFAGQLQDEASKQGFQIAHQTIEVRGHCSTCR